MRLIFTDTAEADLETIGDYIALSNPFRAVSYIRELREECLGLEQMSRASPLLPQHEPTSAAVFTATT